MWQSVNIQPSVVSKDEFITDRRYAGLFCPKPKQEPSACSLEMANHWHEDVFCYEWLDIKPYHQMKIRTHLIAFS